MQSEWECVQIGQLVKAGAAILQTGPFGSQLHKHDYVEHGVAIIPTEAIGRGAIRPDVSLPQISSAKAIELSRHKLCKGDILFARRGVQATGLSAVVGPEHEGSLCGTGAILLRVRPDVMDPHFLAAVLATSEAYDWLRAHAVGAVMPNLNSEIIGQLAVPRPTLDLQRAIARVSQSLSQRVDLLRQTNATLESIAQAIFKSWFIDFDPVRAKAEGREPDGMDAATAALFPAEFEESELGLIPKNWRVVSVYEVANVIYGAPFSSRRFNTDANGQPLVRIRDLRDEAPGVWTPEVHPKGYLLHPGDIVVGMDGEFRAYLWGGTPAWMNQRVCCFRPVAPHCAAFVRCAIAGPLAHIEATEVATTVIHLGKGDIDRFKVVAPPEAVASAFAGVADPLYARIVTNKAQARHLSELRDALLPRLISGKLRLPEVREQAENALA